MTDRTSENVLMCDLSRSRSTLPVILGPRVYVNCISILTLSASKSLVKFTFDETLCAQ